MAARTQMVVAAAATVFLSAAFVVLRRKQSKSASRSQQVAGPEAGESKGSSSVVIRTTEMHTGGEPVRIVESGYPHIPYVLSPALRLLLSLSSNLMILLTHFPIVVYSGATILEKRRFAKQHLDHLRCVCACVCVFNPTSAMVQ